MSLFARGVVVREMQPELWEIGLDGMIGGNGSYVEYDGKVIHAPVDFKKRMPKPLLTGYTNVGWNFSESNNGLFLLQKILKKLPTSVMRQYAFSKGKTAAEVEHMEAEDALHGLIYGGELYRDDLNKVSFILNSYQDHLDSAKAFPSLKAGTWGGRGETRYLETSVLKDIAKAHAIDVLLEHLQADKKGYHCFW